MSLDVGKIILGCGNFGGVGSAPELFGQGETEVEARAVLAAAVAHGIRAFDTAHSYGGGASEAILGRFLQSLPQGQRETFSVATKIGNPAGTRAGRRPLEPAEVERQLDLSLYRLKLGCAPLLYLHEPDRATPLGDTAEALAREHARGRFRHLGLCNVSIADVEAFLAVAPPRLAAALHGVQNEFHYLDPSDRERLIPFLRARGLRYSAFGALAGGMLSGKYRRGEAAPAGSRLALRPQPYLRFLGRDSFALVDELARTARRRGEPLPRAALRFALAPGHADTVVIGPRRPEHLASLLGELPRPSRPRGATASV